AELSVGDATAGMARRASAAFGDGPTVRAEGGPAAVRRTTVSVVYQNGQARRLSYGKSRLRRDPPRAVVGTAIEYCQSRRNERIRGSRRRKILALARQRDRGGQAEMDYGC